MQSSKRQYMTFVIGDNTCGIPIDYVQEVAVVKECTPVPLSDSYIKGLLNLRGQIVTVVDLRDFFSASKPQEADEQRDIFFKCEGELFAFTVSNVRDVVELDESAITSAPPELESRWQSACSGVSTLEADVIVVLNLEKIIKEQIFKIEESA